MKAETIAQYQILDFIKRKFSLESLELEALDDSTIQGTDKLGQEITFMYDFVTGSVQTMTCMGGNLSFTEEEVNQNHGKDYAN